MATDLAILGGAPEVLGALALINLGLMALLFVLLFFLIRFHIRRRYYTRVRLGSPKIGQSQGKEGADIMRGITRIILVLLIIAAIALALFSLAKMGMWLATSAGKLNLSASPDLTNTSSLPANSTVSVVPMKEGNPELNVSIKPENATLVPVTDDGTIGSRIRDFMLTYAAYILAGFIILIILISVLGSRKQD